MTSTTSPATSGTCDHDGCDAFADLETQTRIRPDTFLIERTCWDHASLEVFDAAYEAATR